MAEQTKWADCEVCGGGCYTDAERVIPSYLRNFSREAMDRVETTYQIRPTTVCSSCFLPLSHVANGAN